MLFVLGAKGSAWAWRNGRWDSVEHFKRVQRKWAIWGARHLDRRGRCYSPGSFGGLSFTDLKHSAAYEMAVAKLQASPIAASILGSPIATGTPMGGNVSVSGASGKAGAYFLGDGPKGRRRRFCRGRQERRRLVDHAARAQAQRQRQA